MLKRFNDKINADIESKIISPMTDAVRKIRDLEKRVTELEKKPADEPRSEHPSSQQSEDVLTVESLTQLSKVLVPTHLEETISFVLSVTQLAEKKDAKPNEIADRIKEDYGTVGGGKLVTAMCAALKDTKKKKLKDILDDVEKLLKDDL